MILRFMTFTVLGTFIFMDFDKKYKLYKCIIFVIDYNLEPPSLYSISDIYCEIENLNKKKIK